MKRFSIKTPALHWQIVIAIILAVTCGIFFPIHASYTAWIGKIFLSALKMVVMPLIAASIIAGVAGMDGGKGLGRLSAKTFAYYIGTSLLAILTGLMLANIFQPGKGLNLTVADSTMPVQSINSLSDTLYSIFPSNIFEAFSSGNLLGVIVFSLLFGYCITQIDSSRQKLLSNFFMAVSDTMMKLTQIILAFTPVGVFALVYSATAAQTHVGQLASGIGKYFMVVIFALSVHAVIWLPALLYSIGKISPLRHLAIMRNALLTAFSTSSSNAALPVTLSSLELKGGISARVCNFTLPLGATINMNGTALYECVAALFIAQAYGIELSIFQQIIVVFTALLASVGAAGIPMAGLVTMTIILSAVGLPAGGIALILAVDRPLDMIRTTINVYGDSVGCAIIAKSEGENPSGLT